MIKAGGQTPNSCMCCCHRSIFIFVFHAISYIVDVWRQDADTICFRLPLFITLFHT